MAQQRPSSDPGFHREHVAAARPHATTRIASVAQAGRLIENTPDGASRLCRTRSTLDDGPVQTMQATLFPSDTHLLVDAGSKRVAKRRRPQDDRRRGLPTIVVSPRR